jgi:hypothetical protein
MANLARLRPEELNYILEASGRSQLELIQNVTDEWIDAMLDAYYDGVPASQLLPTDPAQQAAAELGPIDLFWQSETGKAIGGGLDWLTDIGADKPLNWLKWTIIAGGVAVGAFVLLPLLARR